MSRENNTGELYIEIVTPQGEKIAYNCEIGGHEFHEYLGPIHINKNPFVPDDEKEIENQRQKREFIIDYLKEKITFSFGEYFKSKDTIDGFLAKDKEPQ